MKEDLGKKEAKMIPEVNHSNSFITNGYDQTYRLVRANKFWAADGITVPVDDAEDAEEESSSCDSDLSVERSKPSSSYSSASSNIGGSAGSLAS